MSKFTVGPRVGMAIVFCIVLLSFGAGFYFGWSSFNTWGLQTEVAVLKQDSKVGKQIADFEVANEREVAKYAEEIKRNSKSECDRFSIKQLILVCTTEKSEPRGGNSAALQVRDIGQ